ncbi:ATP-binding protein [Bacillus methanolicus]|uniref:ATP-binding protein n=1 Tax=Bacillus methanolicus TaxID=1471 RepID=UPI00238063D9|nr:ATP-binding protein [Bacillus methanolicus]MDE3840699.1 ATP-binding protein [Bacillus methanolicus]
MRDVAIVPINENESLVIAADNSGGIGMKDSDHVKVPYDILSYYSFRVAVMECMAAGAKPVAVAMQNFCGDDVWPLLKIGVERGLCELGINGISITGSTESNFSLLQSALGMVVVGRKARNDDHDWLLREMDVAVIGFPLVGEEVINNQERIAPLSLFKWFCEQEEVEAILPVGSKGIMYELQQLFHDRVIEEKQVSCSLDLLKSAGPATCFLVVYRPEVEEKLRRKAGKLFHPIKIID